MRFYIVLATLSIFIWAAAAGVSGVSQPSVKAVEETPATDAAPPVEEAAVLPAAVPAGPPTPAEQKLDATLKCVEACSGDNLQACQNKCVYSAYNVPVSAGVPTITGTVPGPIATTSSGAPPTATLARPTATAASGANALHAGIFAAGIATLIASFVSYMV